MSKRSSWEAVKAARPLSDAARRGTGTKLGITPRAEAIASLICRVVYGRESLM